MSTSTPETKQDHLLSDEQYYLLNSLAVIILPALGTLYFAVAQIWKLPAAEQVVGTIVAVDTFLGVLIKVGEQSYDNSSSKYAGAINVADTADKLSYSLELNQAPETLKDMDEVTFKVNKNIPTVPKVVVPIPTSAPAPPPPAAPSQ
jgi:hypothetical protein